MGPLRVAWEMARYRPVKLVANMLMWTAIHGSPIAFGLLVGAVFDRLTGQAPAGASVWTPVLVFAALAVARNGLMWGAELSWIGYWHEQMLQLQRNLLRWLLEAPGARQLPVSPGQALTTFRDDVQDLVELVENGVDLGGIALFGVGSVIVMASIDARLTALVLAPIALATTVTLLMSSRIRARRRTLRAAAEQVTGFIGETFGAVGAVKLAHAEAPVLTELRRRNDLRRRAALSDTTLTELLRSVNVNMATIGMAAVLLAAAGAIRGGRLSVGQLTVFLTYLPRLTSYMAFVGSILAQHRRAGVAYDRIRRLAVDAPHTALLDRTPVPLGGTSQAAPAGPSPTPEDRLRTLAVTDLKPGQADAAGASFALARGEFVVITGRIGAGKTTLLRALLGLIPATGEIRWNDEPLSDPAAQLVPPRAAYTPQLPRLFSDTLAANITLGQTTGDAALLEVLELAVFETDLARLEDGLQTPVGVRGVKLSGGQVQRAAAARMFATGAELLVFDDLSSALDLHTEARLWERLFARRVATCLVVSHRPAALRRADQILLMDDGRIVDRGTLTELLERSALMRTLWDEVASGPAG